MNGKPFGVLFHSITYEHKWKVKLVYETQEVILLTEDYQNGKLSGFLDNPVSLQAFLPPVSKWKPKDIGTDIFHHAVYAIVAGIVFDAID